MVIDTRNASKPAKTLEDLDPEDDDDETDPMERAIQIKWPGATVTWKNVKPYL